MAVAIQRQLTPTAVALSKIGVKHFKTQQVIENLIREELLKPSLNIAASAKYLGQLLGEAKAGGASTQFGRFDWSKESVAEIAQSALVGAVIPAGANKDLLANSALTSFFGAAHNDNCVSGPFLPGVGYTEGQAAGQAFSDLYNMGLLEKYGLR